MRFRYARILCVCCILALTVEVSPSVLAAETNGGDADDGSKSGALSEVVVTAQRRSERLQDVPISVTAQSGAALERLGVTETRDLTITVPGLMFTGQGAWIQPNLRGVSTTITGSDNPIAIYLDGVYMPSQNGQIFALPDVSRIEVLKGPQGTLFGRNATGGAIQIFTETPSFSTSGRVTGSAGTFFGGSSNSSGDYAGTLFVTGPVVNDTVAASLAASYHKTPGYLTDDVDGSRSGKIESKLVRGKLLFKINERMSILASAFWTFRNDYETEAGLPLNGVSSGARWSGSILGRLPWHTASDDPTPLFNSEMHGASIKAELDLPAGTLTSVTGYSKLRALENVDVDASYAPACLAAFGCISYRVITPQETESEEINFASRKFFNRLTFTSGLFAFVDRGETGGIVNGGALSFDNVVHTHAYAAYTEANVDIADRLVGIAGARYSWEGKTATGSFAPAPATQYIDVSYNSVTPRASLRYSLTDAANVYFTYSQGFKSGATPTNAFTAPATRPEKVRAYELGAKLSSHDYSLNTAVFYYDYLDKQEQFFDGVVSFPVNAASAKIAGFEMDGAWQVSDRLLTSLGVSWLPEAKYEHYDSAIAYAFPLTPFGLTQYPNYNASGTRLFTTPRVSGNLSGLYTQPIAGASLQATTTVYYSTAFQYEVTGRVRQGPYATVNAQVAYVPNGSRWKASLFGRNLTNRAYINSVLLDGNADMVMYAPPRLVGVKLEYEF